MAERQSRRNSQRLEDSPQEHSRLHSRIRSMLGGSSLYSMSPRTSDRGTPKIPTLGLFRRPNDNNVPQRTEVEAIDSPRESTSSRSPLRRQYTAGSYIRGIGNEHYDSPRIPDRSYSAPAVFRDSMTRDGLDPETNLLADAARRQRRRTRRRKPAYGWLRKKSERGMCCTFATSPPARNKIICAVISGMFLGTILTICKILDNFHWSIMQRMTNKVCRPVYMLYTSPHWARGPRLVHTRDTRHYHLLLPLAHHAVYTCSAAASRYTTDTKHDRT